MNSDENRDSLSRVEITKLAKERLKAIASALDSTRDWLSSDPGIRSALLARSSSRLFPLLREKDSMYSLRPRVAALYGGTANLGLDHEEQSLGSVASHGFSVY